MDDRQGEKKKVIVVRGDDKKTGDERLGDDGMRN